MLFVCACMYHVHKEVLSSLVGVIMAYIGVLMTIAAGLFFYRLRCRKRLWYGLVELAVAFVIIYLAFNPPDTVLVEEKVSWLGMNLRMIVGLLAGIYVMVRGLDNIEQGLSLERRVPWDRLFYGKVR